MCPVHFLTPSNVLVLCVFDIDVLSPHQVESSMLPQSTCSLHGVVLEYITLRLVVQPASGANHRSLEYVFPSPRRHLLEAAHAFVTV